MNPPRHIPGLDGVRALSAIAVMGLHARLPGFDLGWSGVNCFFVLSGFLITDILIRTRQEPGYFRSFYRRRALRIFPAYYLALAGVLAAGVILGESVADLPYYLFYLQNVLVAFLGWEGSHFPAAFLHTWTLAVEEQFYLLWPLVVYVASPRQLWRVTLALICVAPLFRAAVAHLPLPGLLLPCQVDQLAWGALLAQLDWTTGRERIEGGARIALSVLGVILAALTVTYGYSHVAAATAANLRGSAVLSLFAVFFAAFLIVAQAGGPLTRILETRPLPYLGRVSYGLYLYHVPIFALIDGSGWSGVGATVAKFAGTIAVAAVSFAFYERPFLRLKGPKTILEPSPS